jgi:hypothetical protein
MAPAELRYGREALLRRIAQEIIASHPRRLSTAFSSKSPSTRATSRPRIANSGPVTQNRHNVQKERQRVPWGARDGLNHKS